MKHKIITFSLLFSTVFFTTKSQTFEWSADMFGFFDNREYKSSYAIPQTLAGIRLAPEIGVGFQQHHHIRAGVNGIKDFGKEKLDDVAVTAYYHYDWKPFTFYFGSFSRKIATENFPSVFFNDSIGYYRPNVNGLFWQYEKKKNNISIFLDWTSMQSEKNKEAFIIGSSGIYHYRILYAKYQYYMYHYALRRNPDPSEHIHDNGLMHFALGVDLTEKLPFDTLYVNAGYIRAQERRRNDPGDWENPQGLFIEAQIQWQQIGIKNTFYTGDGMMVFYQTPYNEGDLYWGDSFYQAKTYNRTDLYINIINTKQVNLHFSYSFHFAEKKVSDQQQLTLRVNLDNNNIKEKENNSRKYFWNKWIRD